MSGIGMVRRRSPRPATAALAAAVTLAAIAVACAAEFSPLAVGQPVKGKIPQPDQTQKGYLFEGYPVVPLEVVGVLGAGGFSKVYKVKPVNGGDGGAAAVPPFMALKVMRDCFKFYGPDVAARTAQFKEGKYVSFNRYETERTLPGLLGEDKFVKTYGFATIPYTYHDNGQKKSEYCYGLLMELSPAEWLDGLQLVNSHEEFAQLLSGAVQAMLALKQNSLFNSDMKSENYRVFGSMEKRDSKWFLTGGGGFDLHSKMSDLTAEFINGYGNTASCAAHNSATGETYECKDREVCVYAGTHGIHSPVYYLGAIRRMRVTGDDKSGKACSDPEKESLWTLAVLIIRSLVGVRQPSPVPGLSERLPALFPAFNSLHWVTRSQCDLICKTENEYMVQYENMINHYGELQESLLGGRFTPPPAVVAAFGSEKKKGRWGGLGSLFRSGQKGKKKDKNDDSLPLFETEPTGEKSKWGNLLNLLNMCANMMITLEDVANHSYLQLARGTGTGARTGGAGPDLGSEADGFDAPEGPLVRGGGDGAESYYSTVGDDTDNLGVGDDTDEFQTADEDPQYVSGSGGQLDD